MCPQKSAPASIIIRMKGQEEYAPSHPVRLFDKYVILLFPRGNTPLDVPKTCHILTEVEVGPRGHIPIVFVLCVQESAYVFACIRVCMHACKVAIDQFFAGNIPSSGLRGE